MRSTSLIGETVGRCRRLAEPTVARPGPVGVSMSAPIGITTGHTMAWTALAVLIPQGDSPHSAAGVDRSIDFSCSVFRPPGETIRHPVRPYKSGSSFGGDLLECEQTHRPWQPPAYISGAEGTSRRPV